MSERITKICPNPTCKLPGREFSVTASNKNQVSCSRRCASLNRMSTADRQHRSRARGGRRPDLDNKFFRSSWEANYARYLNWLIEQGEIHHWVFEPKIFYYPYRKGNVTYTPDFKVFTDEETYEWHEIKGYMDQASKVKIKRFAKWFPEEYEVWKLIDGPAYREIAKLMKPLLEHWE